MISKSINDGDPESLIFDVVKEIDIESAAHTEPIYSLSAILNLKNITELRELARALHIKNYSKLRKPELICSIAETHLPHPTISKK